MTTETTAPPVNEPHPKQDQIDLQEKRFSEVENSLATCRAFWAKHRETLLRFSYFGFYGWDEKFGITATDRAHAMEIAKSFGEEGWKREFDSSICGRVNWVKTVDGMEITIHGAEMVKPTLNETVKL